MEPMFSEGFSFRASATDATTVFAVNVCGHSSVGLPLTRNMNEITEDYVDLHGVDNLIIPISVGEPRQMEKNKDNINFVVDVVVHPCLTKRCVVSFKLHEHLVTRLIALSIEWIKQECGVTLGERGCGLLGVRYYGKKQSGVGAKVAMEKLKDMLSELNKNSAVSEQNSSLPPDLTVSVSEPSESKEKKVMVQELPQGKGIKRGFLNGSTQLYDSKGSSECTGKTPDPLAHIPQSLRDKCKIIDTRDAQFTQENRNVEKAPEKKNIRAPPSVTETPKIKCAVDSIDYGSSAVVVSFRVPESCNGMKDLDLEVTSKTVEVNGCVAGLSTSIDPDNVRAKYIKSTKLLVVTCSLPE
ncbi:hypothetical protein STCU_01241 [Strigomonas culicis]|uniref:PIH1 N-terminal domain-containing protein n=1 Tax=Strigomonas culicis TaxID=28005 RepID=S9TZ24_9TRYP|nr:hypothetical protein STCU_08463 [Strigomonas culicis]EPY35118.1 hypothetical protein STCU_01241 [Strigomonas culicis]|eukprot:EPY21844.1 hypothetical protein STCU_08463 [Strigomonas culicis]